MKGGILPHIPFPPCRNLCLMLRHASSASGGAGADPKKKPPQKGKGCYKCGVPGYAWCSPSYFLHAPIPVRRRVERLSHSLVRSPFVPVTGLATALPLLMRSRITRGRLRLRASRLAPSPRTLPPARTLPGRRAPRRVGRDTRSPVRSLIRAACWPPEEAGMLGSFERPRSSAPPHTLPTRPTAVTFESRGSPRPLLASVQSWCPTTWPARRACPSCTAPSPPPSPACSKGPATSRAICCACWTSTGDGTCR